MEAAIIGVLGAGLLGLLGIFLQAIRSDIRALGTRLDNHETILGDMRERLVRIEAIQADHGRVLDHHSRLLDRHSRWLERHSRWLERHSRVLDEQSSVLNRHSRWLAYLMVYVTGCGERITALERRDDAR